MRFAYWIWICWMKSDPLPNFIACTGKKIKIWKIEQLGAKEKKRRNVSPVSFGSPVWKAPPEASGGFSLFSFETEVAMVLLWSNLQVGDPTSKLVIQPPSWWSNLQVGDPTPKLVRPNHPSKSVPHWTFWCFFCFFCCFFSPGAFWKVLNPNDDSCWYLASLLENELCVLCCVCLANRQTFGIL